MMGFVSGLDGGPSAAVFFGHPRARPYGIDIEAIWRGGVGEPDPRFRINLAAAYRLISAPPSMNHRRNGAIRPEMRFPGHACLSQPRICP